MRFTGYVSDYTVVGRRESTYTIAVSTTNNMPHLVDGVPSAGSVAVHEWKYYTFRNAFGSSRDLHVTLTTGTGNADLYLVLGMRNLFTRNVYVMLTILHDLALQQMARSPRCSTASTRARIGIATTASTSCTTTPRICPPVSPPRAPAAAWW